MADRSLAELIPRGVGLGCWQFGDMGRGTPADDTSVGLIREAYRKGMRHFDTAHDYGMGHSEAVVGRGIEPISEKAFVSTKMHAAGKAETIAGVEKSLARLKREWIDLFYVHWPKTGFDLRPMMESLELLLWRYPERDVIPWCIEHGIIQSNVTAGSGSILPAVAEELTGLSDEAMRHIPDVGNIFLYYP